MARQLWLLVVVVSLAAAQPSPYDRAASEVNQGHFQPAIAALRNMLTTSPDDLRARNLLGIALVGMGRGEEANAEFRRAFEIDRRFLPALKNLASNELRMDQREEARRHFEAALKLAPADPAVHLGLAQIEFSTENMQQAFAHYARSAGLYLREPGEILRYAISALAVNQPQAARDALSRLPAGSDPRIRFEAGLALAKSGQYEDAARQFELGRPGAIDSYQVDFNLTLAMLKARKYADAVREARRIVDSGERTAEAYSLLAQAYEGLGQTKDAYDALRTATLSYPNDQAGYLELVALCAEHENYDLAVEIAGIGLRLMPGANHLQVQRGIVLAMMGRFEDSYRDLDSPKDETGWIARAVVMMRTGRVADAIADLRNLKTEGTDDYIVNWLLAEALTQAGGPSESEAIAALKRSVLLNPAVLQSRLLLGKLLFATGDNAGAVEQLERALVLDPASVPVMYQLARALQKQGDRRRAGELFAAVGKQKTEGGDDATKGGMLRIVREAAH